MSSVSSEQSCVRKGVSYDKVFQSGRNNLGTSSDERNPSATSPFTRDKDLDTDRSEGDSADGLYGAEPPTQFVIGPNGLKEFIILPLWTVNDFISTIKQSHFNTLRDKYQKPRPHTPSSILQIREVLLRGCRRRWSLWSNAESMAQILIERFPLLPPSIPIVGRHSNCPKCLKGFPWHRGFLQGHVRWVM